MMMQRVHCFAAYGFRVRASVDGITYYSKRVLPELLHPNRTWQESLNIPSGITCTTNVDLSLEGINLLGTNQLIWPIVQLRLVQVATGMVRSDRRCCARCIVDSDRVSPRAGTHHE